jgi:hypothetical protein
VREGPRKFGENSGKFFAENSGKFYPRILESFPRKFEQIRSDPLRSAQISLKALGHSPGGHSALPSGGGVQRLGGAMPKKSREIFSQNY